MRSGVLWVLVWRAGGMTGVTGVQVTNVELGDTLPMLMMLLMMVLGEVKSG